MRDDLHELDDLDLPDVRARVGMPTRFSDVVLAPESRPHRRLVAGVAAILVFLVVGGLALYGLSPLGTSNVARSPSPSVEAHQITSTALIGPGNDLRCTVTFPSSEVFPGNRTGATFTLTNVSTARVKVSPREPGDLVIWEGGRQVVDTGTYREGIIGIPLVIPVPLAPGASLSFPATDTAVLWPGPLHVVPRCAGTLLPAVTLQVANPGRTPDDDLSVQQAVADAGRPFSDCKPQKNGEWVTGTVHRGTPTSNLSFRARCGGVVLENPGFDTVILAIVSPSDAPSVNLTVLPAQSFGVPDLGLPRKESVAISWWVFVVTNQSVQRVAQRSVSQNCEGLGGSSGTGIVSCRFPTA